MCSASRSSGRPTGPGRAGKGRAKGGSLGWAAMLTPTPSFRKKSLEGMKKARVGGSDEEASGIPSRTASLELGEDDDEQEDDDIEYFCQAVGKAPSEGMEWGLQQGTQSLSLSLGALTLSLPTDLFPEAKRKRLAKSPGRKRKRWEMDRGRGRLCDQKFPKTKDKSQGAQARRGPRGASRDGGRGQGRGRPGKRVA